MVLKRGPLGLKEFDHPWVFFILFTLCDSFLAYSAIPLEGKLFVFFYGMILPSILFLLGLVAGRERHFSGGGGAQDLEGILSRPGRILIWVFLGLLAFTRFFRIGSNPAWPIKDVGHFGILALSLSQKWDGRLLWGECQSEPLYLWGLGLFYKLFSPSSLSTRLFPALVSILTLSLGYAAARQVFSRGLSFLAVSFLMVSFWDWVFSRTGIGPLTVLPLEFLVLGLLARALKTASPGIPRALIFTALGAATGLGFYSYAVWPSLFLAVTVAVVWRGPAGSRRLRD